jgi:hypothetical protein
VNKNRNKNEIVEYLNECTICYSAVINKMQQPEIQLIKFKKVFKNSIILGVCNRDMKYFNAIANENISIAIWNKIEGYQLKGCQISKADEQVYADEIEIFKNELKDANVELSKVQLVLCSINDIYNVTPGKFAGQLVG